MSRKVLDITGQRFALLTVTGLSNEKKISGEKLWICKCECGGTKLVTSGHLIHGFVRSCGCLAHPKYGILNKSWKGYKEIGSAFWGGYKRGAKIRNIPFDISIEEGWVLFEHQNKCCYFTGQLLYFSNNSSYSRCGTASLDRKDPSKGYITGNCAWVHKDINRFKNNYSIETFLNMCKMVTEYSKPEIKRIQT